MKKYLLYLLVVPLLATLVSCDSDDDFPPVDITVSIDGAVRQGNTLYVVQGDVLDIAAINMKDNTSKGAVIGSATYFWDYYRVAGTITKPYSFSLDTSNVALGRHLLQIEVSIYAVDYAPCLGYIGYDVVVVESSDQIPSSGDIETNPVIHAQLTDNTNANK